MKRAINISLRGDETSVTMSQDVTTRRMVTVSLSKSGFSAGSDGTNRHITVSFGNLQSEVRWNDITNKPNGKMFGGVITPSSSVPSTSQDLYYLAFESGLYTAFGFTLEEGKMAIVYRQGNVWVRTMVSMDTVGFVQGTRENQNSFAWYEMDELRKSVAFYYGREGFFIKTAESDDVMTFTLVASAINVDNVDGVNLASFYLRGARMFVNKIPNEGTDEYSHWFDGESKQFYLKDEMDQMAAYFEENKQDTIFDLDAIRSGAADGATAIQSSEKGTASGVATLDSGGKVPQSQLPSYVDDVLEYANLASFPANGESGKIYVALDTNKTYRWSGSTYVEISQSLAIGETESTAFAGNRGKAIEEKIPSNASPSNKLATEKEAVPKGGTTGQVLGKHSDEDNDVEWIDPPEGGGTGDYEELDNLPSINGVTLMGELETEDLNIEALTNEEIDQLLV